MCKTKYVTNLYLYLCRKQEDTQPIIQINVSNTVLYKQKKQTAKILHSQNQQHEDISLKRKNTETNLDFLKKGTKTSKLQESNQGSDIYIANKDVDELVSNVTNSIIEKTFGDDLNGEENTVDDQATESWTEDNKDQEGNRKYQLN